ncbi:sugar ABC transporter permease [Dactylosporangium sp. NBC_01737]|uniref:sugar ABC transporter permease n=1 Tax=Dactylosporangium sp. NBC_01737 TaxID=2975959 RepID=UPI002E137132|nr:sugar ABC transporter permease [Dactylosporangium sp. NBC_01737]
MTIQPTMLRPPPTRPGWQVAVGLVLTLPALVLLLTSYVEPLYWTVSSSFRKFSGLRMTEGGEGVGWDNYDAAYAQGRLADAHWFALSLAIVPILLVVLLAPAIAWAAHAGGTWARWVTRIALALPIAAFAPVAIAVGLRESPTRSAYWLGTFGLVVALAATAYLAALRRRTLDSTRSPVPAALVVGGLAVLAVVAVALQDFTFAFIGGFGSRADLTPARLMYETSFRTMSFGAGAAISVTLLLPLILLGLAATLLVILPGTRLEVDPKLPSASKGQPVVAWVVGGVLLLATLGGIWSGLGPWLSDITETGRPGAPSTWVNTWLPPVISTLVGVTVAALAAFGISGLRPFGRHSEWLLLPFGLFLFVGSAPLALRNFAAGVTADRLDSFIGLIPPSRVAIPALFVLALLFRGQAQRREVLLQEGHRAPWTGVVLPALPMLALAYVATWLVQAQDLIWPLITAAGDHPTAQNQLVQTLLLRARTADQSLPYAQLLPLWLLLLLVAVVIAAQLLYLDRLALRVGLPERDHPPRT